jgi:PilZ domain
MGFLGKIVGDSPDEPEVSLVQDRRSDARYVSVLKLGRAILADSDQLCMVRNFSGSGMKIDLPVKPEPDQPITIELRSDRRINGVIRWSRNQSAGIEFDHPIILDDILDTRLPSSLLRQRPRAPRFLREETVQIALGNSQKTARLNNISLYGGCLESESHHSLNDQISISIAALPPRIATIRWTKDARIGLQFHQPWAFAELAPWLDNHR